jgi:hypothetical protein
MIHLRKWIVLNNTKCSLRWFDPFLGLFSEIGPHGIWRSGFF